MTINILAKIFEHNNWANTKIIELCSKLSDAQLDSEPHSATFGTIRVTLTHLVSAQQNYLSLLTVPVETRQRAKPAFSDLRTSAESSGEGLLNLARDPASPFLQSKLTTNDHFLVDPWVVMLQVINHASEHREQICSMVSALGITPPELDGWAYGDAAASLLPISEG